jgi:nickel-dependent lactate racemase
MVNIPLPYGNSFLDFHLRDSCTHQILHEKHVPGLKDEREAILDSLENPLGCRALRQYLRENDKVVIITTDNTRPCPDDRILPPLLEVLTEIIPADNITIIIGLGLHAPLDAGELREKLGADVVDNYRVVNHDPSQCVYLGQTSRDIPVEINRIAAASDFRISTGFIEPHFFAGFSGGRKSIAPATSSVNSIRSNHSYAMLDHPCARTGVLENNPVHEDMVEQARIARLDFIVNVVLNDESSITHVFSGEPVLAHETGCRVVGEIITVPVDGLFDITVTTNGGAPLDLDFYQAVKGIDSAARITREGGIIIIAASCYQGVGPEDFLKLHSSCQTPGELLAGLSRDMSYARGVSWQNQVLARIQQSHQIYLKSDLSDDMVKGMMVEPVRSVEEGLEKALQTLGDDSKIAVIPRGPLVLPSLRQQPID